MLFIIFTQVFPFLALLLSETIVYTNTCADVLYHGIPQIKLVDNRH